MLWPKKSPSSPVRGIPYKVIEKQILAKAQNRLILAAFSDNLEVHYRLSGSAENTHF